ncbi:hypothetical protein [Microseira sp. BLCC-F43]|uniref:hypothetical protein n=1 Tax=Microseira sp. BLCC-F43 TaxID=3153602 RepID=UPI0035B954F8
MTLTLVLYRSCVFGCFNLIHTDIFDVLKVGSNHILQQEAEKRYASGTLRDRILQTPTYP